MWGNPFSASVALLLWRPSLPTGCQPKSGEQRRENLKFHEIFAKSITDLPLPPFNAAFFVLTSICFSLTSHLVSCSEFVVLVDGQFKLKITPFVLFLLSTQHVFSPVSHNLSSWQFILTLNDRHFKGTTFYKLPIRLQNHVISISISVLKLIHLFHPQAHLD